MPVGNWGLTDFELERAARSTLDTLQQPPSDDKEPDEVRARRWYSRYTPLRLILGMWGLAWGLVEYIFSREREPKRYGW